MGNTNYPNGFPYGVTVRGMPLLNAYPGKVFWVCSGTGVNGPNGTFDKPLLTIVSALTRCVASRGDIIMVKAGHTETIAAAAGLVLSVAGVCIVFLGDGSNRGTITFTATASDMDVTAANITLVRPRFLTGVDAVAAAIHVAAADFTMLGAEYYDAAAVATTIQVLTTGAADRMVIDGYRYVASTTGTQKTDGIKTVGGDSIILRNIDIRGDFTASPINVSTAATNILLENLYLNNTSVTPQKAITLHANTTGFAKNVKLRVASGVAYTSSVAKVMWSDDCEGFNTDGYGGEPIGTAPTTGLEGKVDSLVTSMVQQKRVASVDFVAAGLTGTATKFTISGGPIRVLSLGLLITTVLPAGANTLQFSFTPTGGGATTISGATDTASAAVRTFFMLDGVAATGPVKTTAPGVLAGGQLLVSAPQGVVLSTGVLQTVFSAGPPATGAATLFMEYVPLTAAATVA